MIWLSEANIGTRLKDNMIGYIDIYPSGKLSISGLYRDERGHSVQVEGGD